MSANIEKIGTAKFRLQWGELDPAILDLDFAPFLGDTRLNGINFTLLHYQAKPKGLRTFGMYCRKQDSYFCVYDETSIVFQILPELIIIPENTIPNAAVLFKNSEIKEMGDNLLYIIRS